MSGENPRALFGQQLPVKSLLSTLGGALLIWLVCSFVAEEHILTATRDEHSRQENIAMNLNGWIGEERSRYVLDAGMESLRWVRSRTTETSQSSQGGSYAINDVVEGLGSKLSKPIDGFWHIQQSYVPLLVWRGLHLAGWLVGLFPLLFIAFMVGRFWAAQRAKDGKRPSPDLFTWGMRLCSFVFGSSIACLALPVPFPFVYFIPLALAVILYVFASAMSVAAKV